MKINALVISAVSYLARAVIAASASDADVTHISSGAAEMTVDVGSNSATLHVGENSPSTSVASSPKMDENHLDSVHSDPDAPAEPSSNLRAGGVPESESFISRLRWWLDLIVSGTSAKATRIISSMQKNSGANPASVIPDTLTISRERLMDLLGWKKFPDVEIRVDADDRVEGTAGLIIATADEIGRASQLLGVLIGAESMPFFDDIPENAHEPLHALSSRDEVRDRIVAHNLRWMTDMEVVNYDVLLALALEAFADPANEAAFTVMNSQIERDVVRSGYLVTDFESPEEFGEFKADCSEIVSVYGAHTGEMFYSQGMIDYCFFLRKMWTMSIGDIFYTIKIIVEQINRLSPLAVDREDMDAISFYMNQYLFHMMEENIYASDEFSERRYLLKSVMDDLNDRNSEYMNYGQGIAGKFHTFLVTAGFQFNVPNKGDLLPMIDFVLQYGRSGLFAIFMAAAELNAPIMRSLMDRDPACGHDYALEYIASPFTRYAPHVSPVDIVFRAHEIVNTRIGQVSFSSAIAVVDSIASYFCTF